MSHAKVCGYTRTGGNRFNAINAKADSNGKLNSKSLSIDDRRGAAAQTNKAERRAAPGERRNYSARHKTEQADRAPQDQSGSLHRRSGSRGNSNSGSSSSTTTTNMSGGGDVGATRGTRGARSTTEVMVARRNRDTLLGAKYGVDEREAGVGAGARDGDDGGSEVSQPVPETHTNRSEEDGDDRDSDSGRGCDDGGGRGGGGGGEGKRVGHNEKRKGSGRGGSAKTEAEGVGQLSGGSASAPQLDCLRGR